MAQPTDTRVIGVGIDPAKWWIVALVGLALIVASFIVLGHLMAATLVSAVLIGAMLIVGGLFQIMHAFAEREWGGFTLSLLIGLLYLATGAMLGFNPVAGASAVTLLFAAFLLATSKLQHMMLPLALAVVIVVLDRIRLGRTSWRAAALLLGALAGLSFQFVQTTRDGLLMATIRQYNRADVVFTALTPFADDPKALLAELGIDPGCAVYSGKRAWQLPDLPDRTCRGLVNFTRGTEIAALIRHPLIAARLLAHGVGDIDPWISDLVGHVEGGAFEKLPSSVPSLGRALHASAPLRGFVLALPFVVLIVLSIRPGWRRGSAALDAVAIAAVVMSATLAVTLLGDGLDPRH